MGQVVDFTVKAKAEHASAFRRAFKMMEALVDEDYLDDKKTAIRFKISCDVSKVGIMEREVPLEAYAGVAYTSSP